LGSGVWDLGFRGLGIVDQRVIGVERFSFPGHLLLGITASKVPPHPKSQHGSPKSGYESPELERHKATTLQEANRCVSKVNPPTYMST